MRGKRSSFRAQLLHNVRMLACHVVGFPWILGKVVEGVAVGRATSGGLLRAGAGTAGNEFPWAVAEGDILGILQDMIAAGGGLAEKSLQDVETVRSILGTQLLPGESRETGAEIHLTDDGLADAWFTWPGQRTINGIARAALEDLYLPPRNGPAGLWPSSFSTAPSL